MTNADKYLKDGVDADKFVGEFNDFVSKFPEESFYIRLAQFLKYPAKPTLSEDEKVILRHRPLETEYIGKDSLGLYVSQWDNRTGGYCYWEFSNAFDFIKERRRI